MRGRAASFVQVEGDTSPPLRSFLGAPRSPSVRRANLGLELGDLGAEGVVEAG